MKQFCSKNITIDRAIYFILFAGVFLRASHFGSIPAVFLADEMRSAIDAYTIAHYGTDRYGISYPAYFVNYGLGQSALYPYLCAVSVYLFGFNAVAVRLPMLLGSVVLGVFGMLIVGRIFKNENPKREAAAKLLFVSLFAFAPYPFMAARIGLDCNLMLPCSVVFLYFLLTAVQSSKTKYFIVAGIFGGVLLYSYVLSYLVLPVFLILLLSCLLFLKNVSLKNIVVFSAPLFVLALPLLLVQYVNMFNKPAMNFFGVSIIQLPFYRASELTVENFWQNIFLIIKSTLAYDWIDYNTISKYWTFYPMSALFFFIGLFSFLRRFISNFRDIKILEITIIFLWLIAEIAISSFLGKPGNINTGPNTNKLNGIFFAVMVFIVLGFTTTFSNITKVKWKNYLAKFIVVLYLIYSISFFNFYFHDYEPKFITDKLCSDVITFIKSNDEVKDKRMFYDSIYPIGYPYLVASSTDLLNENNLPFPLPPDMKENYGAFYPKYEDILPENLPEYTAYICHKNKIELIQKYREKNFKIVEFKDYVLIYR